MQASLAGHDADVRHGMIVFAQHIAGEKGLSGHDSQAADWCKGDRGRTDLAC